MTNPINQRQSIDLSGYFDKKRTSSVANNKNKPEADVFLNEAKIKRQHILLAVISINFLFGILIFSYLIIKSNEEAALVTVMPDQFVAPVNYQLKPGEIYRPALP